MAQIALVTNKHDDDVRIGVIPQLLQPPVDILISLMLADVVNKEGTDGATVVSRGNRAVALLTSSVPNLCLDCLRVDLNGPGRKLHTDC